MVSSVSGSSTALGQMSAQLKETAVNQELGIAVAKKGLDVEKAQGEAALKLIDSSTAPSPGRIDLYA